MARKRQFLTPDTLGGDDICRPLSIPLALLPSFGGALAALTEPHQWEQFGAVTPQEAAEECTAIVAEWYASVCGGESGGPCVLPTPTFIDVEFTLKIIRRGAGGHTEELTDGVWSEPTGDYEVPPVPAREEPLEADRLCLAAANAANVLAELYEEITDAIAVELSAANVFSAIYNYAVAIIGVFAGAAAASYAALGEVAFDAFLEAANVLGGDVWTNEFTDELTCFLYDHATDNAGVVTFDWAAIRNSITAKFGDAASSLDADRAILWGQVGYLFDILGADGIDHAGTTTALSSYDCAACQDDCTVTIETQNIVIQAPGDGEPSGTLWVGTWNGTGTVSGQGLGRLGYGDRVQRVNIAERRCVYKFRVGFYAANGGGVGLMRVTIGDESHDITTRNSGGFWVSDEVVLIDIQSPVNFITFELIGGLEQYINYIQVWNYIPPS